MRAEVWICDRCGARLEIPVRRFRPGGPPPLESATERSWVTFFHEEKDDEVVCPDCVTVVDEAEMIVRGAEDIPF